MMLKTIQPGPGGRRVRKLYTEGGPAFAAELGSEGKPSESNSRHFPVCVFFFERYREHPDSPPFPSRPPSDPQIQAGGRRKGGGVKLAKSPGEARDLAAKMLGMMLKTIQTGPEGQKVRKLYIEEGLDIAREL